MKKYISENKYSLLTLTAMFTGILFIFFILAASEVPAQLDKLKKAVKKVENEIKREAPKTKPADTNKSKTETENNPNTPKEAQSAAKNANQNKRLIFSDQPIDPNNPANLKTSFQAGEHIYGLLILDKPFKEFVAEDSTRDPNQGYSVTRPLLKIDFLVDGEPIYDGTHVFVFSLEDKQNAWNRVPTERYFFFDIAPEPTKQKTYGYNDLFFPRLSAYGRTTNKAKAGAQFYSHQLSRLKPGNHKITVKIAGKEEVIGEFTISGGDYAVYSRVADQLETVSSANAKMPESKWNNPALANSVKTAYKRAGNETVLRVNLLNPDWFIQRNALGQILFRGVFAAIATKTPDGKCYLQREYFKQNYSGGRYGATAHDGRSETRQIMPCENVMK